MTLRDDRAQWLRDEIRREHQALWGMIPGMMDPPGARRSCVWEDATHKCLRLLQLAAELEGVEAK